MDLLLLFLTSHWQPMAAPSLELAIIFHLRKGIEKENTFWCVCVLSIIQRQWHFTTAFFFFSLQIMMWHQGRIEKQDEVVSGVLSSPLLSLAFLQIPVPFPGWTVSCSFLLCQPVIYRTSSVPHSWAQLWALWVWTSTKRGSAAGSKCSVEQAAKAESLAKIYLFAPHQAK